MGKGLDLGALLPRIQFCRVPSSPPPPLRALIVSRYWVSLVHRQLSITSNQSGWSSSSESSQWENRTLKSFLRCWGNLFSIMSTVSSSPCIGGEAEKSQFLDHGTLLIVRMPQWHTFIDFRKRWSHFNCLSLQASACSNSFLFVKSV